MHKTACNCDKSTALTLKPKACMAMGFVTYCVGKLAYIEVLFLQNIRQHVMVLNYNT
jgi:hypothetical protein